MNIEKLKNNVSFCSRHYGYPIRMRTFNYVVSITLVTQYMTMMSKVTVNLVT